MATPNQSIDPALLALQTAKKALPASPSTQQKKKPVLQSNIQQSQAPFATSSVTPAKIGGISSPFGATNINSSPVLGGATPTEIGTTAKQLQSLPKAMPDTGAIQAPATVYGELFDDITLNGLSEEEMGSLYPEIPAEIRGSIYDDIKLNGMKEEELYSLYPELAQGGQKDNFITDLGSGVGQSITSFGKAGKKLAIGAVNLYRQSQGKEKLTPEQIASAERTPMGQALETITNWQTPEQKASIGGQLGMVAGSVAQGAALGTPLTNVLGKIPGAAQIATKAPVLSKIAGGVAQGLEGQLQYSAAAEGKLPTPKELFTAGAFGGAVNAIGPIAKGIKDMKAPKITAPFKGTRNTIAEGLVGSNLKNPAMREKYISKVGQTPEKTLLDEGITGSLGTQATKVAEKGKQAYDTTREALKSIPTQFKSDEGLWITNKILEGVDTSIPGIEDVIAPIKDMNRRFANGSASAMDMNDAKLLLARYEGLYDDFGRVKKTGDEFEKKALAKMYNNMKTEIENVGEQYGMDIKSMNKETQKREGLRGLMDRAVAREAGRDMISLSDYMLGGITIADPMTAIPLTLGKKFFSSPKVTSKIAKFLYSKGDDVITNSASNANMNVANGATKQGIKYPIKLQQEGMQVGGATLPKPMPKTPPITVEKGAIGMGTPKANKTPVIPPKTTVAPSVSAPKVDTFARMTELDSNPLYKKISFQETNYGRNAKGLETEFGTIQKVNVDNRYNPQSYTIDGVQYPTSQINNFREKQAPEVVAQANKVSKAISDLKAIESGKGKIMGSNLRSVLDDLGIKDVNSIPEGTEEDILQMVRARKPVSPKKGIPKLGKEIMEQNITQGDDLIQEAKKYKSADEFINNQDIVYHGTNNEFDNFQLATKKTRNASSVNSKAVFFADDKNSVKYYGKNIKLAVIDKSNLFDYKNPDHIKDLEKYLEKYSVQDIQPGALFGKDSLISFLKKGDYGLIESKLIQSYIKKKGFDGFIANDYGNKDVYGILSLDKIKTEAQLKQIREQANKKPLPPLPKKGK